MGRPVTVTGLDIGSFAISALVAEIGQVGGFRIVAHESKPSRGVSKGVFSDLGEACDVVSLVLRKISEKLLRRPENIYVNITGDNVKGERSRGMIPISLRGREITPADIERCVNVASTIRLPFDRDIIHRVVQNFSIDDQPWIKNPLGLYASRLACEVYVISAGANHIQNVHKCLNGAGYDVKEVVFTGMAEGESLLDDADRSGGAAILDIGNSVTEFTLFSEGALSEMHVMPLGSRDLAGDFKERAEFQNLISVVKDKTAGFVSRGGRMNAVILGGGFAFVDGTVEVLEERLGFPVKMGVVKGALGNIPAIGGARSAVAMGLARYGRRNYEKRVLERGFLAKRLSAKVVDIFNNYF